jgi:hypothetical protein
MTRVLPETQPANGQRPLDGRAVLRYSAIFAAIVVPAGFIALGLPATVLATWLIGRMIARRYHRQIVVRETLILALASWAWTLVASLLREVIADAWAGVIAFQLAWHAVAFVTTWAAYLWLTVMKRADAVLIDVTHLSANLHWELRAIADHTQAEQLILACGVTGEAEPDLPAETRAELAGLIGDTMLQRSQRFFYELPRQRPRRNLFAGTRSRKGWLKLPKADAARYGSRLATTLDVAFAASDRVAAANRSDSRGM